MSIKEAEQLFGPIKRTDEQLPNGGWRVGVQPPAMFKAPMKYVELTDDQYRRYKHWLETEQGYIQDVLSDLSGQQREILINGDPLSGRDCGND